MAVSLKENFELHISLILAKIHGVVHSCRFRSRRIGSRIHLVSPGQNNQCQRSRFIRNQPECSHAFFVDTYSFGLAMICCNKKVGQFLHSAGKWKGIIIWRLLTCTLKPNIVDFRVRIPPGTVLRSWDNAVLLVKTHYTLSLCALKNICLNFF
jgi:hypothetical protein